MLTFVTLAELSRTITQRQSSVRVAITAIRPIQSALIANALAPHADRVTILSSAPRRYFRGLAPAVALRLVPSPAQVLHNLLRGTLPKRFHRWDVELWDRAAARLLPLSDAVIGFATQSLHTLHHAKSRGARTILDRACPHVDFQQAIVRDEAVKVGARYLPEPPWFRQRQLDEYATADAIVVPSRYSADTFPPGLRPKIVIAPLLPRELTRTAAPRPATAEFTLGVLGGNPLRKGYLYLLEAWHQLALPNARLLLRAPDLTPYPRLAALARHPTIERIGFLPHISDFYARCDAFALPSVDDGFGMALLEAMAHGVPVLTTTHTGASELLTDGVDGLITPPFSAEALAEAILRLYQSPALRQSIGQAGQATVARVEQQQLFEQAYLSALTITPGAP